MDTIAVTFNYLRPTKNTYRYDEVVSGEAPLVGALYIQKWAIGADPPEAVNVTIEAA